MCFPEGAPTPYITLWVSFENRLPQSIHWLIIIFPIQIRYIRWLRKPLFLWTNSNSRSSWVGIFWIQLSLPGMRYMYVSIYIIIYIHSYLYIYMFRNIPIISRNTFNTFRSLWHQTHFPHDQRLQGPRQGGICRCLADMTTQHCRANPPQPPSSHQDELCQLCQVAKVYWWWM